MNGDTIQIITNFVEHYVVIAYGLIPFGVILEGDITLIFSGIFSHLSPFSFPVAFLLAYAGAMGKSLIGYFLGRYFKNKYPESKFLNLVQKRVLYYLPNLPTKPFWSIFISKFLYGFFSINYFVLIFLGYINIDFKKFLKYELIASFAWVLVGTGAGYLFSFTALQFTKNLQKFFLIILVLIAVFFVVERVISFIVETIGKYRD